MFRMTRGLGIAIKAFGLPTQKRFFYGTKQPQITVKYNQFVEPTATKMPNYNVPININPKRTFAMDALFLKQSVKVIEGSYVTPGKDGPQVHEIASIYSSIEDKDPSCDVLTTSDPLLHEKLRKSCMVDASKSIRDLLNPGEEIIGMVELQGHGSYFGGSPISSFPEGLREQIYVDKLLPTAASIREWEETERSIADGPRLSGYAAIVLIRDKEGNYRQEFLETRGFVNSTLHYGTEKDAKGKDHPLLCYTPGTALKQGFKFEGGITTLPDGGVMHSASMYTTGAANVLTHWMCKVIGETFSKFSGSTQHKTEEGKFLKRVVEGSAGQRLHEFAGLLTGTPFFMGTITFVRNPEGKVTALMIHNRTKLWPASELLLTMSQIGEDFDLESLSEATTVKEEIGKIRDKSESTTLYSLAVPDTTIRKDLTVTKLITLLLSERTLAFARGADGKFHPLEKDTEQYQMMLEANKQLRFSYDELRENDATVGMLLSAFGASVTDKRPRVAEFTETGDFSEEQRQQMLEKLTQQNPKSMEHYFCNNAVKILAVCLNDYVCQKPNAWENNENLRALWNFITSKTPNYENLEDGLKEYEKEIKLVLDGQPEVVKALNTCAQWARKANTEALIQKDENYGAQGPILT